MATKRRDMVKKLKKKKIVKGIKLTMDDELQKKYEQIKEYLGVQADAEVIRILINQFYRDIVLPSTKRKEEVYA